MFLILRYPQYIVGDFGHCSDSVLIEHQIWTWHLIDVHLFYMIEEMEIKRDANKSFYITYCCDLCYVYANNLDLIQAYLSKNVFKAIKIMPKVNKKKIIINLSGGWQLKIKKLKQYFIRNKNIIKPDFISNFFRNCLEFIKGYSYKL